MGYNGKMLSRTNKTTGPVHHALAYNDRQSGKEVMVRTMTEATTFPPTNIVLLDYEEITGAVSSTGGGVVGCGIDHQA